MPSSGAAGASAPAVKRGPSAVALALNLAIIYVIWGSTYFGIAVAIETMPPFLMASIRFAIAGIILVAFDLWRHPEARRMPTRRQLVDTLIVGGLLLGIGNGFVTFGELTVPSGIAAILIAMIPLWFAVFGWLYFREKLPRIVVLAIVIGFAGTALLVAPTGEGSNSFDLVGIVILLLAPIAWSHGSIYSARKAQLPPSPLTASGLQMLAGAGVTLIEALVINEPARFHPETFSTASILAVLYLIVFGSMLAFTTYAWLLRNAPLSLVGTYAYVNPVVAVALGTIFLAEPISLRTIIASVIILAAVAIIVTARGRLASNERATARSAAEAASAIGSAATATSAAAATAPSNARPAIPP